MKNIFKTLIIAAAVACSVLIPGQAFATSGSSSSGSGSSTVAGQNKHCDKMDEQQKAAAGCDLTGDDNAIKNVVNIINVGISVGGILAVFFIIIGGIQIATSQGDPSKFSKGKSTIIYAVIGLIVMLVSYAIVAFVSQSLGDTTSAGSGSGSGSSSSTTTSSSH
jgi:hypothetical protein